MFLTKFSPTKIKIVTIGIILAMILRYTSLLVLSLAYNIKYLYLLKPLFFLNFISIPLLALTVLYIFIRVDTLNYSYIFIVVAILVLLYCTAIYKCPSLLQILDTHGYTMLFYKDIYIYWIYVGLNTIVLFGAVGLIARNTISKIAISLVIISSAATIIDIISWFIGIKILHENILGDMLWGITLIYALSKVKKKRQLVRES
ncbi:hypothetical protein [Clostridium sp. DJ247]|uniref:hypothetical protein n=1 Tax=Clostridium sp. DJ247 TaxID=2726188 RepID=UPI0016297DA5|nr:hypothetical protein [Clostridium sp. DJ247]MBC2581525.1 hypothetical protein [Clostridium sp. DJ247]